MTSAERLLQRCDELAQISSLESGVLRAYLTPQHQQANQRVIGWMTQAGMDSWQDQAGNIWGRYSSSHVDAKVLIIGSHLDTVPNAGKYDGILGVLAAIELVDDLHRNNIQLPFHIEVVGFGEEEGYRFGAALLGSHAVAGSWKSEWLQLQDKQGVTLAQAFEAFGLDAESVPQAARDPDAILGYWELHIEQGPVLEDLNLPMGIVTGIAGARRFEFTLTGSAGHAGTVPMHLRRDALVGAAEIIQAIEQLAIEHRVVATVGRIQAHPGGVNVIAGEVKFSLDIRSDNDQQRDKAFAQIEQQAQHICQQRQLQFQLNQTHAAPAVECAPEFMQVFQSALEKTGLGVTRLASGAGHDAMAMASLCKVGMLFLRCDRGISHHPDEAVTQADVVTGLVVLRSALDEFTQSYG